MRLFSNQKKSKVPGKRIAYIVNHVTFFASHRLPLALAAQKAGHECMLFTGKAGSEETEGSAVARLASFGIRNSRAGFTSAGINPLRELLGILQLALYLFRFKPNIVHCASPKGVLYGGIAARLCKVECLVLAISGMGYLYTGGDRVGYFQVALQRIYGLLAGFAFNHPNLRVIVQNKDDRQTLIDRGLVNASSITLIPGSGVDLSLFADCSPLRKKQVILLPARMLIDKGVYEFVEAARSIKNLAQDWQFVLAGVAGYGNPTSIGAEQLEAWESEGCIRWLGHVEDMVPLFRDAAIVCLPSYREGMPKALLEAAAAGCAVVTTDVTGCREAVIPGQTGELVPARDGKPLLLLCYI